MTEIGKPLYPGVTAEALFLATVVRAMGHVTTSEQVLPEQTVRFNRPASDASPPFTPDEAYICMTRFLDPGDNPHAFLQSYIDASVSTVWGRPGFALERTIRFSRPHEDGGLQDVTRLIFWKMLESVPSTGLVLRKAQIAADSLGVLVEGMSYNPCLPAFSAFSGLVCETVREGQKRHGRDWPALSWDNLRKSLRPSTRWSKS